MRRKWMVLAAALFMFTLPIAALAASGMDHGKMEGMDHGKMKGMDHGKMDHDKMMMEEGMMMLGEETVDGVKAMAHLKDVKEAMAKMNMKETHHFMVAFVDAESGEAIETGKVAVKIEDPSGEESDPIMLMGMQGHFGADVVLSENGEYHFVIGTKLKDGNKRQFHFHHDVE